MAANTSPIFGLTANLGEVTFVNADGTTAKTVFTAGADGSLLKHVNVATDDSANVAYDLYVNDGTTDYLLGSVTVPDLSGTNGGTDPAVDLMDPAYVPGVGSEGLFIPSGYSVKVAPQAAVTAAKTTTVVAIGFDY